jgi:hypothetical protein
MQGKEKKDFFQGGGDFDSADFRVQPNDWVNMENCRVGSTDKGVIGTIESIGSNVLKSAIEPSVTFVCIGSAEDVANRMICFFLKDLYGPWDKIVAYDLDTEISYNVLLSSQVVDGLNFNKDYLIHSARIINGLLYWTDFLNQPRRVNIKAGINLNQPNTFPDIVAYTSPLTAEVITIIRKPPVYPLSFTKFEDVDIDTNQIKNNSFRFTYQYEYRDGEISTLAPHSLLAPYNFPNEDFNSIQVTIPFSEIIDQDVQRIDVVVIYTEVSALGENGFIIKTWDKANSTDATDIANHNSGLVALTFEFANDSVGSGIDSATLVKPFDSVPLLSEALENASNRVFLGRNLLGYDTPLTCGLTAQTITGGGDIVNGNWASVTVDYTERGGPQTANIAYFFAYFPIAIDDTHPAGYYDYTSDLLGNNDYAGSTPSFPTTIDINDYTFIGTTPSVDVMDYIASNDSIIVMFDIEDRFFFNSVITLLPIATAGGGVLTNITVLKSDSPYRLGIVFYDQYLRQCGVVVGPKITTPDRTYDLPNYEYGIQWALPNGPQILQIPDWAYYYSIVSTKSLRTSFFVQAKAGDIVYATKDTDGNYQFTSTIYSDSNAGVALKLDLLSGMGMGYSYAEGDIVKIYISGSSDIYTLSVLAQSGDWVVAELVDLGDLSSTNAFFELYTPRPQTAAELYYEVGSIYKVLDPTTTARRYSVLNEFLPGDVYLLTRGTSPDDYITENMSPNTTLWRNWFTNAGRQQVVIRQGQQLKQTSIKWSNTIIPGTIVNGLSSFDGNNEKILEGELGPLRKLQITSKVNNEQGAVMLGICETETVSMYLGEVQLVGSSRNADVATIADVIGTVNVLKGSFGTINPESVVEFRGNVFWIDIYNGKVIQYSVNGLFPISRYKATRFWKLFCDQFLSMTRGQIEALGSRPFVFMTVDPHHEELLITIPKLLNAPPKGYLPDYPSVIYPFDIYDGQAKTIVYKINAEPNFWQGAYNMTPEGWLYVQNKLFSFKFGRLYEHNSTDSYCNFYGVNYKSRIMFVCNQIPNRPKVYNNTSIDGNMRPSLTYFYAEVPYTQSSDLADFDYKNLEGLLYATIYRNKLIPTSAGFVTTGLLTGDKMRTGVLKVLVEFTVSTTPLELKFIEIGYQVSAGHTTT